MIRVNLKLNFVDSPNWDFHRTGWKYVSDELKKKFHSTNGLIFYEWADGRFRSSAPIKDAWGGILHNVISYPEQYYLREDIKIYCLEDLIKKDFFIQSMRCCKFLFTLCERTANFLKENGINAIAIKHPCKKTGEWQGFNGNIVTVGQWLRKFESILYLKTKYQKNILRVPWRSPYENITDVNFIDYLCNKKYDELLSNSLIFLDFYDVAACNTVLECIMNNVPMLVNRLPAVEEYIGKDYPLFYNSIEEASFLINEKDIFNAHEYLKKKDKKEFDVKNFIFKFGHQCFDKLKS